MRKLAIPLVTFVVLTCSDSPPLAPLSALPNAVAMPDCGPADEPYVAVYLTNRAFEDVVPRAPYLHLVIPTSFEELRGDRTWHIGPYPSGSSAWYHEVETSSYLMPASSGTIRVTEVISTQIEGAIDLKFPDGIRFRGGFVAAWQHRQTFCG